MTAYSGDDAGMLSSRPTCRCASSLASCGQVGLVDLLAKLLDLLHAGVELAELLADGLELLAQEVLALALGYLGLGLGLYLVAELQYLELALEDAVHLAQLVLGLVEDEYLLLGVLVHPDKRRARYASCRGLSISVATVCSSSERYGVSCTSRRNWSTTLRMSASAAMVSATSASGCGFTAARRTFPALADGADLDPERALEDEVQAAVGRLEEPQYPRRGADIVNPLGA